MKEHLESIKQAINHYLRKVHISLYFSINGLYLPAFPFVLVSVPPSSSEELFLFVKRGAADQCVPSPLACRWAM